MEFYQVINNRRTVRDLTAEPIPVDVLERIIAAGIQAPAYDHRREWEFVILRGEEEKENALQFVKAFAEAQGENRFVSASASPQQKMYADAMPKQYSMLRKSGCVILPFFKGGNSLFHASSVSSLNSFASVWCCIENIFLAATAEGGSLLYAYSGRKRGLAGCGSGSCAERLFTALLYRSWLSRKRRRCFRAGGASSKKHATFWKMVKRRYVK